MSESTVMGRKSYAGFFTVNEAYGSNMYFWFFPSIVSALCDILALNWSTTEGGVYLTQLFL